jgi:hypothetical protein
MTKPFGISAETYVRHMLFSLQRTIEDGTGLPHTRSDEEHAHDQDIVCAVMFHVMHNGVDAWPFLLEAIAVAANDDEALRCLGAGDLESLILWHGDELIDEIEERAVTSRPLRVALSNVWGWGPVEDRIERLLAIHGPASRNPPKG